MASPTAATKLQVQRTIMDLDTLTEVTVVKDVDFAPVASVDEAVTRLGNDSGKLIEILNEGLQAEARRNAGAQPGGWVIEDEEGKQSPFSGTQADVKKVNALVLTLAKTVFGYSQDLDKAGRESAKQSALDMVKNTESIRNGLKKSAALTS